MGRPGGVFATKHVVRVGTVQGTQDQGVPANNTESSLGEASGQMELVMHGGPVSEPANTLA